MQFYFRPLEIQENFFVGQKFKHLVAINMTTDNFWIIALRVTLDTPKAFFWIKKTYKTN